MWSKETKGGLIIIPRLRPKVIHYNINELDVPNRPWESISMDYLTGYPTTKHQHDAILVVIDIFSDMVIIILCNKTMTAQQTTQLFFEHVWKHFVLLNDHHFRQRCQICQHILEDSLATNRHETLLIDNFPSSYRRTERSCESLASTTVLHVQPQASSDMG